MRSFNEIYEEIYKENYEEFEKRRKGFLYKNIGVLLVTFLYCFFVLPQMFLEEKEFGIIKTRISIKNMKTANTNLYMLRLRELHLKAINIQ